jgi:hypothetical protein
MPPFSFSYPYSYLPPTMKRTAQYSTSQPQDHEPYRTFSFVRRNAMQVQMQYKTHNAHPLGQEVMEKGTEHDVGPFSGWRDDGQTDDGPRVLRFGHVSEELGRW